MFNCISKPINKISLFLELINSLYEFNDKHQNEDNPLKNDKFSSPLQRQLEQQAHICQDQLVTNKTLSVKDNIYKKQGSQEKSQKTILQNYVQYIYKAVSRKTKLYKFGYINAFQALRCIASKDDENVNEFKKAYGEVSSQLNIIKILKSIKDVEKLKHIIFNENQRVLFDKFNYIQQKEKQIEIKSHSDQQIKQQGITQDAILQIIQDQNNEINQKLIASLDVTVSDLLQKCKQENNDKLENN